MAVWTGRQLTMKTSEWMLLNIYEQKEDESHTAITLYFLTPANGFANEDKVWFQIHPIIRKRIFQVIYAG